MANWKALLDLISENEVKTQHYTTSTKLHNAQRHIVMMKKIIPNRKATDLMDIEIDNQGHLKGAKFSNSYLQKAGDYLGELDAFFYTLRSCIDSFLWETNLIFELKCKKATRVIDAMNKRCHGKKTNKLLQGLNEETWYKYLNDVRNYVTHKRLHEIAICAEDSKLYLPKEPENGYTSYLREKEFEVITCINNLLGNTRDFLEKGYGLIIDDLNS
jgi:hypothetical protein